jgi:hypothetical protein
MEKLDLVFTLVVGEVVVAVDDRCCLFAQSRT